MNFLVVIESSSLSESFVTKIALVGFITRMDSTVGFESRGFSECLSTEFTAEGPDPFMTSHVCEK